MYFSTGAIWYAHEHNEFMTVEAAHGNERRVICSLRIYLFEKCNVTPLFPREMICACPTVVAANQCV